MTGPRPLRRIVATTDVHSSFDDALPMLAHLHAIRPETLIVDCGDFFEGSGYYRLGHGRIETAILHGLYDVIAPGNHGWIHHFDPPLRDITVCANAVDAETGRPLFRRLHTARIGGRRVAITAVIGVQAFHSIPIDQRAGQRVTEPGQALREVMLAHHHEIDSWVVLSHSGFDEDLKLAAVCPFLDVIFAGHCHSDQYGPTHVGETLVLKGRELGIGYAIAEPALTRWTAQTTHFPDITSAASLPPQLALIRDRIEDLKDRLALPIGAVSKPYRGRVLDRRLLLDDLATRLHTALGAEAVVLNETALRPTQLDDVLTFGDLLTIEPFNNQLVHARIPQDLRETPGALLPYLTKSAGPLITQPKPLPPQLPAVLTTDYLAESYLDGRTHQAGLRLRQAVQRVLTEGTHR
ncbi:MULTISPECIES: metallophosphoesterase [unclassified Streptomyces]|uniref:metallophosphoesterase n=1 Tax=unclassified Streptomyces TaxID=2593676 RepID=UPI00087FC01B|nr:MULTISPECIES: metallophosphoesterase [unclassified Streptomyces]PBC84291.1 2',3'-cyclic-nucleotide 2'-phosphodiesterase (5'-nucleotidase family) [Streptomyces sp. 2321.6]SDR32745.1 2',3'-cyclic-nucleotide 2'-phosphodiesterase/5'-or 3'-nucleotidase, 5'-nucleotidase family [Streptomyces sp. KS_16]SED26251.1 2',3'-cyclic-nucleotide 2'-phosphodiesterase/5'-or 3'-nucleotidase, 5'-nucleotidase family [Streptomyces sp. 2133.1]SNC70373.1 2',3'-cyclic-nucleotide 2'-phosphodiesterase/5'-or 3'-nucleoti